MTLPDFTCSSPPHWRVAVIGSGPSGFYAVGELLKQQEMPVKVDLFDRLPTPYGLVRGGVAPDHQKICLLYTSPSPRDGLLSRMPSSA